MTITTIMLCGPMTGDKKIDWPVFKKYEDKLRAAGIKVINPLRVIDERRRGTPDFHKIVKMTINDASWKWFVDIRFTLDMLPFCDAVFLMPDWNCSINSLIIALAAHDLNLKLLYFSGDKLRTMNLNLVIDCNFTKQQSKTLNFNQPEDQEQKTPKAAADQPAAQNSSAQDSSVIDRDDDDDDDNEPFVVLDDEVTTVEELDDKIEGLFGKVTLQDVGDWLDRQLPNSSLGKKGGLNAGKD